MPETLRAKALRLFQLKRRLEECDDHGFGACVTCGKVGHYTKMHGGHFIPKGKSSFHAFNPDNVHLQCPGCNLYGMKHGLAAQNYTVFMIEAYGKVYVDFMLDTENKPHKLYAADYKEMIQEFNAEINRLKGKLF